METTGNKSRLRSVRIAGESALKGKTVPKGRLTEDLVDLIASQVETIVEEMEANVEARSPSRGAGGGTPTVDPSSRVP